MFRLDESDSEQNQIVIDPQQFSIDEANKRFELLFENGASAKTAIENLKTELQQKQQNLLQQKNQNQQKIQQNSIQFKQQLEQLREAKQQQNIQQYQELIDERYKIIDQQNDVTAQVREKQQALELKKQQIKQSIVDLNLKKIANKQQQQNYQARKQEIAQSMDDNQDIIEKYQQLKYQYQQNQDCEQKLYKNRLSVDKFVDKYKSLEGLASVVKQLVLINDRQKIFEKLNKTSIILSRSNEKAKVVNIMVQLQNEVYDILFVKTEFISQIITIELRSEPNTQLIQLISQASRQICVQNYCKVNWDLNFEIEIKQFLLQNKQIQQIKTSIVGLNFAQRRPLRLDQMYTSDDSDDFIEILISMLIVNGYQLKASADGLKIELKQL